MSEEQQLRRASWLSLATFVGIGILGSLIVAGVSGLGVDSAWLALPVWVAAYFASRWVNRRIYTRILG